MLLIYEQILELSRYENGEIIPDPDFLLPLNIFFDSIPVYITRRSLAHIIQKNVVGISLCFILEDIITQFDSIFLSTKGVEGKIRYTLYKENALGLRSVAVVLEQQVRSNSIFVITAMIADDTYLSRKYKMLR